MKSFDDLLRDAVARRASDVHLTVGAKPSCRIDGEIAPLFAETLTAEHINAFIDTLLSEKQKSHWRETLEADLAYSVEGLGRFRINVFHQKGSAALVARALNAVIPSPKELGIPEVIVKLTEKRRGLVLVTGATGSGKSTTLASLINIINTNRRDHIITIEDPVEYIHVHKQSLVNQREVGEDTGSFSNALRAALREDPDVILVGEMRDLETISAAVTAAETGHLVFSTLHTIGAANTIDRIIDVFPPNQQGQIRSQLAEVIECVISQQLMVRRGGKGRVAALEIMMANGAIRNHIREGKTYQIPSTIQTNRKAGMITMEDALYELYEKGDIDGETALSYSQDRNALGRKLLI
ncbi:MAG: type IV pilus twitching motility protein PilT [Oscillospiraceae bacterium]|nr:type IV pilus twitching motility protein PilT [Oscillospiraceae bacterium]